MMAANRRRDTKPELLVRRHLHALGFRYRIDVRKLPGSPDIVLRRYNAAIFVHGCFWHRHEGCLYATVPKSNAAFWQDKFTRNKDRDRRAIHDLRDLGWRVAVVWECTLRAECMKETIDDLADWVYRSASQAKFGG
jgi:DNA mismatch endonuclease, patch repair protein